MASYSITDLTQDEDPATDNWLVEVNIDDTSTPPASAAGSNQKITIDQVIGLVPHASTSAYGTIIGNGSTTEYLNGNLQFSQPPNGGTLTEYVAPAVSTLTFGTSIAVNAALGNAFNLTLTSSSGTMAAPSNPVDGQVIRFRISQDATGGRTLTWGYGYSFGSGSIPTLSTAASKVDIIGFEYVSSIGLWCCLNSGGLGY